MGVHSAVFDVVRDSQATFRFDLEPLFLVLARRASFARRTSCRASAGWQATLGPTCRLGATAWPSSRPIKQRKEVEITYAKPFRAVLGGAVAIIIANIVSNVLFFQLGRDVLFENDLQSPKVTAVLFEMDPLPLMFTNGPLYMAIAAGIGVAHGLVFLWIEPALPRGIIRRGASFAVILWALMALYFEFHTPFNMFGEPPVLVAVELGFWAVVTLVQGLVLSTIYGRGRHDLASAKG